MAMSIDKGIFFLVVVGTTILIMIRFICLKMQQMLLELFYLPLQIVHLNISNVSLTNRDSINIWSSSITMTSHDILGSGTKSDAENGEERQKFKKPKFLAHHSGIHLRYTGSYVHKKFTTQRNPPKRYRA